MLPKPTYTGGSPASRNASSSFGSGRSSGRIQAPVWTMSRSVRSFHGARTGIGRQPDLVREDVVADVVDRGQADRRAAPVERLARTARSRARRPAPRAPGCRSPLAATACPAARSARSAATAARRCGSTRARSGCRASRRPIPRSSRHQAGRDAARHNPRPPREASRTARRRARPRAGTRRPATAPSARPPPTASTGRAGSASRPTRAKQRHELLVRRRAHPHLRAELRATGAQVPRVVRCRLASPRSIAGHASS